MGETVFQVDWIHAMEGFKADDQHLELHPEVDFQPFQLMKQWCNMDHSMEPKHCSGHHFAPVIASKCSSRVALCTAHYNSSDLTAETPDLGKISAGAHDEVVERLS